MLELLTKFEVCVFITIVFDGTQLSILMALERLFFLISFSVSVVAFYPMGCFLGSYTSLVFFASKCASSRLRLISAGTVCMFSRGTPFKVPKVR